MRGFCPVSRAAACNDSRRHHFESLAAAIRRPCHLPRGCVDLVPGGTLFQPSVRSERRIPLARVTSQFQPFERSRRLGPRLNAPPIERVAALLWRHQVRVRTRPVCRCRFARRWSVDDSARPNARASSRSDGGTRPTFRVQPAAESPNRRQRGKGLQPETRWRDPRHCLYQHIAGTTRRSDLPWQFVIERNRAVVGACRFRGVQSQALLHAVLTPARQRHLIHSTRRVSTG